VGRQTASLPENANDHPRGEAESQPSGDAGHDVIPLLASVFSAKAIQHGRHPANVGRMAHPDAHASRVGWCGEVMEMYLRLDGDRVVEATFWADGCLSTMACGDMLTTMAKGMTVDAVAAILPETLIAALDGLPYKSHHCAELSTETMREAIASRRPG
jgi:nitrogen fixation NifU-like protein